MYVYVCLADNQSSLSVYDAYEQLLTLRLMKRKESDYTFYEPGSIFSRVYSELFSILTMLENDLHFSQQTKLVALRYAVYIALKSSYFCRLLDSVSFPVSLYCPYAFTCVMIAYKYEENCERVMSVADIISFPNRFCESLSEYSQMEMEVLSVYAILSHALMMRSLQWNLHSITASHFLSLYTSPLLAFAFSSRRAVPHSLVAYCSFFLDLLSSLYKYRQFSPSLQADVCFSAACRLLHIESARGRGMMGRWVWDGEYSKLMNPMDLVFSVEEMLWDDYYRLYPEHVKAMEKWALC